MAVNINVDIAQRDRDKNYIYANNNFGMKSVHSYQTPRHFIRNLAVCN